MSAASHTLSHAQSGGALRDFGRRVVEWAELFSASVSVASAWESRRRAPAADLKLIGIDPTVEDRILGASAR